MSEAITPTHKNDTHPSPTKKVTCSGPGASPHPRVTLTMVDDAHGHPQNVVCPYCGKVFTYTPTASKPSSSHP